MDKSYAKRHRQLRVFISSTFADMNAERDALTHVFPQIRELCEKRGVVFVPLDLRWGITESAAKQGRVLDTCMREIDQSRPFFIGLVGNRYGWVPTIRDIGDFDESLQGKYPWLHSALDQGMSITEMEMQYAALRNISSQENSINATFYLRSSKMTVPKEYCEETGSEAARKLEHLREKIRQQKAFPVRDYDSPKQLAEQVKNDLIQFLNREFPQEEVSSWDSDMTRQEYILESRSKSLFDLSRYDAEFLSWVKSTDNPWLAVTGNSGRGKSYLLASMVRNLRTRDNNPAIVYCDFLSMDSIESVIGFVTVELLDVLGVKSRHASERSTMLGCLGSVVFGVFKIMFKTLLFSIQWALGNQKNAEENLANSFQDYVQDVVSGPWRMPLMNLAKALRKKPKRSLFVALDNLDAMNSQDLTLLNVLSQLPHIRYICTASTGTKAQIHLLNTIKAKELKVGNLYVSQSQHFITNFLAQYSKNLDEQGEQRDRLVHSSIGGNPRLLSHVLNLMVCFGSFEEIDSYISSLASVKDSQQVYEVLIRNILKIFPAEEGGRAATEVLQALSLIPDGIKEEELKEMLDLKPLEWANVRPYVLDLCSHRDDKLLLPSDDHYNAIRVTLPNMKEEIARKIASFFEKLLEVRLQHTDFIGNPDLGKVSDDSFLLVRQVQVLPNLYLGMQWADRLYEWCTYQPADALMSESERINYWRLLYHHGFSMKNAPNPDISPYVKRSMREMSRSILFVGKHNQNYQNYIHSIYNDQPLCSSEKELENMYQRWAYVAGLLQQQEDCLWLSQKMVQALGVGNDLERRRVEEQNHAQHLLIEKRYDELIVLKNNPRYNDIHQVMIDFYLAVAYRHKDDYNSAFRFIQLCFEGISDQGGLYMSEMIPLLSEYCYIACHQNETDAMNTILPILEYHLQQQQQNGIDSTNVVMLLYSLATLYLALGRRDDSLRTAYLWLDACKNMKLPTELASQFIAQFKEKA